jgi:dienelactone hydrolase
MNHTTDRRHFLSITAAALASPIARAQAASTGVPQNLHDLWQGFAEMDRSTPLEIETLKSWAEDGTDCQILRYQVGVFKGASSRVAAFFACPTGAKNLPALIHLHGGGQSASLSTVKAYASRGYAALSINWGGNRMRLGEEDWAGPQTDWGKLDATHPPQRNKANHFAGPLTPDEFTLDAVESPRNSNWYLVLVAARRALSLLERQPVVDPARIGALGHSMGGKLTMNLAAIDRRIKAAVPSCGGAGDLLETQTEIPGGSKSNPTPLYLACISDNAYIPLLPCPVLWLSPTNDFHGHIDNMAWNWRDLPDGQVRFSISPHLDHRHTPEHAITEFLWLEQHLKGSGFTMPETPRATLDLATHNGVPQLTVTPDRSMPPRRVDVYYSTDPHGLTRFWRDGQALNAGETWRAECPLMQLDQPLFAFANAIYDLPERYRDQQGHPETFAISSRVLSARPEQLTAAAAKATDKPERLIDDGARGWHDWYLLNWNHPPLWSATTRKLKDARWRGPDGATLDFEIICEADNQLVITFTYNAWGAITPGEPSVDYTTVKVLKGTPGWQKVSVLRDELAANDPNVAGPPADWRGVTAFSISPSGELARDGTRVKVGGKAWQGPREIRNLRWVHGEYPPEIPPATALRPEELERNFNRAIESSLE